MDKVLRGDLVLYTPREWQRRASEMRHRSLLWSWLLFPPMMLVTSFIMFGLMGGLDGSFWVIYALTYSFLMCSIDTVSEWNQHRWELSRHNFTGLFEHGIQWRMGKYSLHYFLPYFEILSFEVKKRRSNECIEFRIRDFKKPWRFGDLLSIVGPEGLEVLHRKVAGVPERPGPPRLYLHGDRLPGVNMGDGLTDREPRVPVFSAPIRF